MLNFINLVGIWFDLNYEKIWLITIVITMILFVISIVFRSELIYDLSEDCADFYDEILSE